MSRHPGRHVQRACLFLTSNRQIPVMPGICSQVSFAGNNYVLNAQMLMRIHQQTKRWRRLKPPDFSCESSGESSRRPHTPAALIDLKIDCPGLGEIARRGKQLGEYLLAGGNRTAMSLFRPENPVPRGHFQDTVVPFYEARLHSQLTLDNCRQTGGVGVIVSFSAIGDFDLGHAPGFLCVVASEPETGPADRTGSHYTYASNILAA